MPSNKPRCCTRCKVRQTYNRAGVCNPCLAAGPPPLSWREASQLVDGVDTGPRVVRQLRPGTERCGGGLRILGDRADY